MLKKKICNFQRIVEVFTQKKFQYALKYMGLGSGIRKKNHSGSATREFLMTFYLLGMM
jgi:hypothetical protein